MNTNKDFIIRTIGTQKTVWFKNSNRYVQMKDSAFAIFDQLQKGESYDAVVGFLVSNYKLPIAEARRFINEIQEFINEEFSKKRNSLTEEIHPQAVIPPKVYSEITYQFENKKFLFKYGDETTEQIIHPIFAHLKVISRASPDNHLDLFTAYNKLHLVSDGAFIGQWDNHDDHLFKGKVFMELLNKGHSKQEKDWMTVLHASAVGNGKNSLLFAGDSGSGKSTLSAILMANGFNILADDFVPIIASSAEVMQFPAAISIKKQAFKVISSIYPELLKAKEFHYKKLNKTVRYLPVQKSEHKVLSCLPVKALVFVRYKHQSGIQLNKIPREQAFRRLVPDSWVSPLAENAERFLDWFASLACYELIYSDNDKVVSTIKTLIEDEL